MGECHVHDHRKLPTEVVGEAVIGDLARSDGIVEKAEKAERLVDRSERASRVHLASLGPTPIGKRPRDSRAVGIGGIEEGAAAQGESMTAPKHFLYTVPPETDPTHHQEVTDWGQLEQLEIRQQQNKSRQPINKTLPICNKGY